jgi:hypothetical protein
MPKKLKKTDTGVITEPLIRLYVASNFAGKGNIKLAENLIHYLISIGFTGDIQLIYPEETRPKLDSMGILRDRLSLKNTPIKILALSLPEYDAEQNPQFVKFGFCAEYVSVPDENLADRFHTAKFFLMKGHGKNEFQVFMTGTPGFILTELEEPLPAYVPEKNEVDALLNSSELLPSKKSVFSFILSIFENPKITAQYVYALISHQRTSSLILKKAIAAALQYKAKNTPAKPTVIVLLEPIKPEVLENLGSTVTVITLDTPESIPEALPETGVCILHVTCTPLPSMIADRMLTLSHASGNLPPLVEGLGSRGVLNSTKHSTPYLYLPRDDAKASLPVDLPEPESARLASAQAYLVNHDTSNPEATAELVELYKTMSTENSAFAKLHKNAHNPCEPLKNALKKAPPVRLHPTDNSVVDALCVAVQQNDAKAVTTLLQQPGANPFSFSKQHQNSPAFLAISLGLWSYFNEFSKNIGPNVRLQIPISAKPLLEMLKYNPTEVVAPGETITGNSFFISDINDLKKYGIYALLKDIYNCTDNDFMHMPEHIFLFSLSLAIAFHLPFKNRLVNLLMRHENLKSFLARNYENDYVRMPIRAALAVNNLALANQIRLLPGVNDQLDDFIFAAQVCNLGTFISYFSPQSSDLFPYLDELFEAACTNRNADVAEYLLDKLPSVTEWHMQRAAKYGLTEVVDTIAEKGVDAKSAKALAYALQENHVSQNFETIRYLVETLGCNPADDMKPGGAKGYYPYINYAATPRLFRYLLSHIPSLTDKMRALAYHYKYYQEQSHVPEKATVAALSNTCGINDCMPIAALPLPAPSAPPLVTSGGARTRGTSSYRVIQDLFVAMTSRSKHAQLPPPFKAPKTFETTENPTGHTEREYTQDRIAHTCVPTRGDKVVCSTTVGKKVVQVKTFEPFKAPHGVCALTDGLVAFYLAGKGLCSLFSTKIDPEISANCLSLEEDIETLFSSKEARLGAQSYKKFCALRRDFEDLKKITPDLYKHNELFYLQDALHTLLENPRALSIAPQL